MAKLTLDGIRQVGKVTVRCRNPGVVVVSSDFVTALRRGGGTAMPEELREVEISGGGRAAEVLVKSPVSRTASGALAARTRVVSLAPRASGRLRPFPLDARQKLPQTLFIQGSVKSSAPNDTSYDIEFYDATGKMLAAGTLKGTVVRVTAILEVETRARAFDRDRKVLALATGQAEATTSPDLSPGIEWSFPPEAGTLATPTRADTSFAASRAFTPVDADPPVLRLGLTYVGGQVIEVFSPLRITAPRQLQLAANSSGSFLERTGNVRSDKDFSLFKKSVTYLIRDQYGEAITESAYGGAQPTIRENIHRVLRSAIPALQTYINDTLSARRDWDPVPSGQFTDRLEASQIPVRFIRRPRGGGGFVFVNDLLTTDDGTPTGTPTGVLMEARPRNHVWSISVNGDAALSVDATDNTFRVEVSEIQNTGNIRFTSRYQVVLP